MEAVDAWLCHPAGLGAVLIVGSLVFGAFAAVVLEWLDILCR